MVLDGFHREKLFVIHFCVLFKFFTHLQYGKTFSYISYALFALLESSCGHDCYPTVMQELAASCRQLSLVPKFTEISLKRDRKLSAKCTNERWPKTETSGWKIFHVADSFSSDWNEKQREIVGKLCSLLYCRKFRKLRDMEMVLKIVSSIRYFQIDSAKCFESNCASCKLNVFGV